MEHVKHDAVQSSEQVQSRGTMTKEFDVDNPKAQKVQKECTEHSPLNMSRAKELKAQKDWTTQWSQNVQRRLYRRVQVSRVLTRLILLYEKHFPPNFLLEY